MTIHEDIARDVAPMNGGELRCDQCGNAWRITQSDVAHYFATGWPRCHGLTMRWVTDRELRAERLPNGALSNAMKRNEPADEGGPEGVKG